MFDIVIRVCKLEGEVNRVFHIEGLALVTCYDVTYDRCRHYTKHVQCGGRIRITHKALRLFCTFYLTIITISIGKGCGSPFDGTSWVIITCAPEAKVSIGVNRPVPSGSCSADAITMSGDNIHLVTCRLFTSYIGSNHPPFIVISSTTCLYNIDLVACIAALVSHISSVGQLDGILTLLTSKDSELASIICITFGK